MKTSNSQTLDPVKFEKELKASNRKKSDSLIEMFLGLYFVAGLLLAFYYDTWLVAVAVGGSCLLAYFISKKMFPTSNVHHYVASTVLGIYMAQFIYQMHGLFEMHFFAFVGAALMITYQNWKTQIPVALVVVAHHALFGYLQYESYVANAPNTIFLICLFRHLLFMVSWPQSFFLYAVCGRTKWTSELRRP
jgi:hypothetical protein